MNANFRTAAELLDGYRAALHGPPPELWPVGTGGLATVEIGPGRIVLLGGAPGVGKTALTMQWVIDALRAVPTLRAVTVNVEMHPHALLDRQLSRLSGVPLSIINKRQLGPEHAERIDRGLATLESVADRLAFVAPPFDLEHVARAADAFAAKLLLLDYVQRIRPPGEHSDKRSSVNALMDYLRRFADVGLGVLAIAAVGRTRDKRGRSSYTPTALNLASFRESSELEYGCDSAYLLLPADASDPGAVTLSCCKHRFGELVDVPLRFDRVRQAFTPIDDGPTDGEPPQIVQLRKLWATTPPAGDSA